MLYYNRYFFYYNYVYLFVKNNTILKDIPCGKFYKNNMKKYLILNSIYGAFI